MNILLLITLINLPYGEARANGLADASVTIADQPLALYVNPALLTRTDDRKLLYNPVGFPFNPPRPAGVPFNWENFAQRIVESYSRAGFIGYSQPVGDFGAGLAGFQDEEDARGILVGTAYKLSFLHAGASLGIRYLDYVPTGESHVRPVGGLGLAVPDIKFADVPGEISVAVALRQIEWFSVQAGMDYNIEFFRFLVNFHLRNPQQDLSLSTVHLAGLFTLKDLLNFDAEIGGGWASDNRWGVLLAADLNLARINLSYSRIPPASPLPNPNPYGRIAFSFLFNIASTREVEERLASIENERKIKSRTTSSTYTKQGMNFYNEGNFDAAIQSFDVALIWDPTNQDALSWLERARDEKNSTEIRGYLDAANEAMRKGDYLEAMNNAQAALDVNPDNAEAKSLVDEAQRKFSSLVLSQTAAISNAGEIGALYQKGMEQYAEGNFKDAAETWGKIEKLQPKSTTVKSYQQKTSQKITEQIASGLKRLEVLERKGSYREALNLARRLKSLAPSNREITTKIANYESKISTLSAEYENQGVDYYNRGYYVKAQNSFYALLALDPDNATATQYLSRIESKLQKKDADALYLQGVQAYADNQYEQAIAYWQQVLKIDPNYDNASRNIQRAREKLEQLK